MLAIYDRVNIRFNAIPSQCSGTVPQPLHARGLVGRIGLAGADVDLARNGLVDDGLLLLLQQRNQLLLGADVAPDAPVGVVEEADDGGLFRERAGLETGYSRIRASEVPLKPIRMPSDARVNAGTYVRAKGCVKKSTSNPNTVEDKIGRTYDSIVA